MRRVALALLLVFSWSTSAFARGAAASQPVRKELPGGAYELRQTWPMRNGVRGEQVRQYDKEGRLFLSQRATFGRDKRVTYRHTRYNPDGSVNERGLYKVWTANGVRFSVSKTFDARGRTTYADRHAKGPSGRIYERQTYGGMLDVTRSWIAKKTRFYIYTRQFLGSDHAVLRRYGAPSSYE